MVIGTLLLAPAASWSQTPGTLSGIEGARPIWSPSRAVRDPEAPSSDAASSTLRLVQDGWGQRRGAEPSPSSSSSTVLRWRSHKPQDLGQTAGLSIPLEPANWQEREEEGLRSPIRTISHEQSGDPLENPFGDKVVQDRNSPFELAPLSGAAAPADGTEPLGQPAPLPSLDDLLPPRDSQAKPPADLLEAPQLPSMEELGLPAEPPPTTPLESLELSPPAAGAKTARPKQAAPEAKPSAPQPNGAAAPFLPPATKPAPNQEADEPRLPLRTPAPYMPPSEAVPYRDRAASDCQRIYNDRDCCQEDENCNAARLALKQNSIKNISLDITASFRPDAATRAEAEEAERDQLRLMPARTWRDRGGRTLAEGRVVHLHNRRIVVEQADGTTQTITLGQLGDDELCFLAAYWRVPTECTLGDEVFAGRNWQPQTFAWTASALSHKPLYFEERQLERYGHTTGPILEPVMSGAHFFLNVAVLPYKMGINPPHECQYPLGYYRPGSCAPWLLPPVPLSIRGGLLQAGTVTGLTFLIP